MPEFTLKDLEISVGVPPMHDIKYVNLYKMRDAAMVKNIPIYEYGSSTPLDITFSEVANYIKTELKGINLYTYRSSGDSLPLPGGEEEGCPDEPTGSNKCFKGTSFFLSITDDPSTNYFGITGLFLNKQEYNKFICFVGNHKIKPSKNTCGILKYSNDCYSLHYIKDASAKLKEINYTDEVISKFNRAVEDLNNKDPRGRINILSGPPGTGKTHLIRAFLNGMSPDSTAVYIPTQYVSTLDSPSFLGFLLGLKTNTLIFILEDCDSILLPRSGDNVNVISSFLNLTDGLLGVHLDIRILASTNASSIKFDKAITRPGRLSESIEIGLLCPEKANTILSSLLKKDITKYNKPVSLAEIYYDSKTDIPFDGQDIGNKSKTGIGFCG